MALYPPFSLVPRLFKGQGLFIIDNRIVTPSRWNAFQEGFHGKFHIFRQAGCFPSVLLKDIHGNAHPCSAKNAGKANIVFGSGPNCIGDPEGNGKDTAYPRIIRVLGIKIPLDEAFPF